MDRATLLRSGLCGRPLSLWIGLHHHGGADKIRDLKSKGDAVVYCWYNGLRIRLKAQQVLSGIAQME